MPTLLLGWQVRDFKCLEPKPGLINQLLLVYTQDKITHPLQQAYNKSLIFFALVSILPKKEKKIFSLVPASPSVKESLVTSDHFLSCAD